MTTSSKMNRLIGTNDRFCRAFCLAVQLHRDQVRKGTGVPYVTHLLAVASLVGEYGGDEDLMMAALLHDTLEDCPGKIDAESLQHQFGQRVAKVVIGCSDCQTSPKPPWEQRKQAFVQRLRNADSDIKLVAASDKLHNASSLLRDVHLIGDSHWERFNAPKQRQLWYIKACYHALQQGWENPILFTLKQVADDLEQVINA